MLMLTLASSFNNSNTNMEYPPRRCYQTARSETSPPTGIPGSPLLLFSTTAGLDSSQIGRDFALKMVILTQISVRSSSCWIFRLLMKSTSCWVWSHQGFLFKQLLVSGAGTTFTYLPVMLFLILPKHISHHTNIEKKTDRIIFTWQAWKTPNERWTLQRGSSKYHRWPNI